MGHESFFQRTRATLGESGQIVASDLSSWTRGRGRFDVSPQAPMPGSRGSPLTEHASLPFPPSVRAPGWWRSTSGTGRFTFSFQRGTPSSPPRLSLLMAPGWRSRLLPTAARASASSRFPSPERPVSASDPLTDFNVDLAAWSSVPTETGAWYPRFVDNENILFSSSGRRNPGLVFDRHEHGESAPSSARTPWEHGRVRPSGDASCTPPIDQTGTLSCESRFSGRRAGFRRLRLRNRRRNTSTAAAAAVPYVDLPRFLAWAPLPVYYSSIASAEIVAAPGALFLGRLEPGTAPTLQQSPSERTPCSLPSSFPCRPCWAPLAWPTRSPRATRTFHRPITGRSCASGRTVVSPGLRNAAFHNDGAHSHHGRRRYPERGRPAGVFLFRRPRSGREQLEPEFFP